MNRLTRKCVKCGENKALIDFPESTSRQPGRCRRCKACVEDTRRERRATIKKNCMAIMERKACLWRNYVAKKTRYDPVKPPKKIPANRKEYIAAIKREARLWEMHIIFRKHPSLDRENEIPIP